MRSSSCSRPGGPREPRGRQWCSGCAPHSSRGRRQRPSVAVGRAYEGTYRECPTPVPTRSAEQLRRRRIHGAGYERGVVADVHGGHVPHGLSSSNRRSAARDPQDRSNRYTDVNPGKLHSATPRTSATPIRSPCGGSLPVGSMVLVAKRRQTIGTATPRPTARPRISRSHDVRVHGGSGTITVQAPVNYCHDTIKSSVERSRWGLLGLSADVQHPSDAKTHVETHRPWRVTHRRLTGTARGSSIAPRRAKRGRDETAFKEPLSPPALAARSVPQRARLFCGDRRHEIAATARALCPIS